MNVDRLIRDRESDWQQLERILDRVQQRGARKLSPHEAERLIHLYRQVAADFARLEAARADARLLERLNRLVVRAHGQIYQHGIRSRRRPWPAVRQFVTVGYPRLFRRHGRCMLVSLLLSAVVYAMAYDTVQRHPEIIADILGGMEQEFVGQKTPGDIIDRFQQAKEGLTSPAFSSLIATNNIRVALTAFALGVTFGVGTVWVLIVNSAMLGGIAGAFGRSGIEGVLWATILPHGALELSAIVVAGGSGLVMGWALWSPGRRTRLRALQEAGRDAVLLAVGLVPVFAVAGLYEGFITPSQVLPVWLKVALGVATAVAFWMYLMVGGRQVQDAAESG